MPKKYQPEYHALNNAIHRCHVEHHRSYQNYGGRGIEVCPEWRDLTNGGFARFYEHIGAKPSPDLSLDRIDNDLGYVPGNVRWATRSQQQSNRSVTPSPADQIIIKQIIARSGCHPTTARSRLKRFKENGDEAAMYIPVKARKAVTRKNRRAPAVLKPLIRNRGENRHARNLSIAADWDAGVPAQQISEKHKISEASLALIVRGKL